MELLQGIEHHVDQEQEAVEKRQSLTPQASFNTSREKSSKRVVLRSGRDLLPKHVVEYAPMNGLRLGRLVR